MIDTRPLNGLILISSIVIFLLYIKLLSILYYFPIYPDEIAIRLVLTRIFDDFPTVSTTLSFCETFGQSRPYIWYFPGAIDWLIHGRISCLNTLRGVGLCFNAGTIALLTWQVLPQRKPNRPALTSIFIKIYWIFLSAGLALSLLSLGVLPVFSSMNRNEQLIIPCLIILLSIFPRDITTEKSYRLKVMLIIAFFTCVAIILCAHPKTILLTPIFLLIGHRLFFLLKNRYLSVGLILVLIFQIIINFLAWSSFLTCTAAPNLNNHLKSMNLVYQEIFYNQQHFLSQLIQSVKETPEYFNKLVFQTFSEVSYLPSLLLSGTYNVANTLIRINFSMLFLTLCTLLPIFYYRDCRNKKYFSSNLLLLVLFICTCGGGLFNLTKHWYDVAYFWTLLIIIFIFFIKDHFYYLLKNRVFNIIFLYLICSGVFSISIFLHAFSIPIKSGFQGPGISLYNYNYRQTVNELDLAVKSCHISPIYSQNLIIDNSTYLFFQKTRNPVLLPYIAMSYAYNNNRPTKYFKKILKQSSGLITQCASLPPNLASYTTHVGSICCAPNTEVKKIIKKIFENGAPP